MELHIMCDIETLGTSIDSTVIQIAAAAFDIKTGEILETFNEAVDISKASMNVDGATIKWWLETDKELLADILKRGTLSEEGLFIAFHDWLTRLQENAVLCLWGNGILFDNNIIRAHMEKYGLKYPIKYNKDRDQRTILFLAAEKMGCDGQTLREKFRPENCHDHDAFDDVKKQVKLVHECYKILVS